MYFAGLKEQYEIVVHHYIQVGLITWTFIILGMPIATIIEPILVNVFNCSSVVATQFLQLTYYLLYHVSAKHTPINDIYATVL